MLDRRVHWVLMDCLQHLHLLRQHLQIFYAGYLGVLCYKYQQVAVYKPLSNRYLFEHYCILAAIIEPTGGLLSIHILS